MSEAQVVIYTTPTCGFCHAAKRLLQAKGVPYDEIDASGRGDLRTWLAKVSNQHTVPQIFINGRPVGGYSELSGLERRGQLDGKLETAPSDDDPKLLR